MDDMFPLSAEEFATAFVRELRDEASRELRLRYGVYPQQVRAGRMEQPEATRRTQNMAAIFRLLDTAKVAACAACAPAAAPTGCDVCEGRGVLLTAPVPPAGGE